MADQKKGMQMWGGVFTKQAASSLLNINSSIDVDKRMYKEDILGSQVYAKALMKAKILDEKQYTAIHDGLNKVREEWDTGKMVLTEKDEDIHSVNERRLKEIIGEPAERLHTGRSRNDQVATDVRLWIHHNGPVLEDKIYRLLHTMVDVSKKSVDILLPGYTHLKRAHPVRFAHFLLNHVWNFHNDDDLLQVVLKRNAVLPLGSGALMGNPFPIDRMSMAAELGFSGVTMNSMNAVGNRDSVSEFLFWCAQCGMHLSRLAEDLILYNTEEFGYIKVSEEFSTGSSLLPQKRNPDGLELARGSAGRLIGNSCGFMATLKSLPSTYNKDLQDDKRLMFDSFDTVKMILEVVEGTIKTMTINEEKCKQALKVDQLAVRLANWLVKNGLPFRQAHSIAGKTVSTAEARKVPINELSKEDRAGISELLTGNWNEIWDYEAAVEDYQATGGTSRSAVMEQIKVLQSCLDSRIKK